MGIKLRYGVAVGILVALFSMLGPVSAQASHVLGTPVAVASHHSGIANPTVLPNYRCGRYGGGYGGGYNRYCCGGYGGGYGGGYNRYCCGGYGGGYGGHNRYCYSRYGR
jgi:hypothetical protein